MGCEYRMLSCHVYTCGEYATLPGGRNEKGERQKERRFFKTFSKLRWGSGEAQERKAKEIVDLAYR